jgi:predicted amidohydrolase YtcJ
MARILFLGGPVVTFDGGRLSAVAVEDGRIVAIGDDATDRGVGFDRVVELDGRALLPAFRDGHAHPLHAGINQLDLDLTGFTTLDEVLRQVGDWDRSHPGSDWLIGRCYEPVILPNAFGRAEWLDAVCPDRPVALFPTDNHSVWVNSAALRAAGIGAGTPDPPLGGIVRDADGSPSGSLLEFGGIDLIRHLLPPLTDAKSHAGLGICMQALAREGIVWAQDASVRLDELAIYADAARAGTMTCRINTALRAEPARWQRQREEFRLARDAVHADPAVAAWVTANTIKFFADGVIESGTGFLLEPYEDAPHTCGLPNWTAEGLQEAVRAFDADGFQIHIHAIGDAGVRMALDAVHQTARLNGPRDRRPVIAHTQLVHPDDMPRFAELGVIANFEPLWAVFDRFGEQLTLPRLGRRRTDLQYPIASLAATGARLSFGSDWPVSSHRPLDGLAVAVTRQTRDGEPAGGWVPEQRYPILQAIHAYTEGSAYQAFDDDAGRIAVGQRADLIVVDHDITAIAGNEVADARIDQTWLAGELAYQR